MGFVVMMALVDHVSRKRGARVAIQVGSFDSYVFGAVVEYGEGAFFFDVVYPVMRRKRGTGREYVVTNVAKIAAPVVRVLLMMSLLSKTTKFPGAMLARWHDFSHVGRCF